MKAPRTVFFDTWGWLAIAHRDDRRHGEATAFYREFVLAGGVPVTSDYILAETISLLRARTTPKGTESFIDGILAAQRSERVRIERIGEERWQTAWKLSKKFADKPDISFADFTSFVVMKELRINEALTADRHFELIGMGFRKLF
ncbi:type II toxin-antitoxin system VapC family toxin [Geobacter sp.]|uniref:type II toxin-antitoxin system VapC family toxin n=1 Tax=Geobacter sp. TaxID=46610 RepID=UPI001AC7D36D|nr:PIN domain-containing protein [Geobacter sp.]CAG0964964.1 23S rRNA-specific endonuclease VapC20 [Anaerolineales bacterium]